MNTEQIKERFLRDVAKHNLHLLRDDGVYRHLRFKQPNSTSMYFDLVTWPGFLAYTGDMGAYVFNRDLDMFEFFRQRDQSYRVNPQYWAEKVEASDRTGVKQFSLEKFKAEIRDWVAQSKEQNLPDPEDAEALAQHASAYAELLEAVEKNVLNCDDNEVRAYDAVNDFEHNGSAWQVMFGPEAEFQFSDFYEVDVTEYSFRFLWCCEALAWGVARYDAFKVKARQVAQEAVDAD